MIPRYQRPIMTELWSLENQYRTWLEVELAAMNAQAALGLIPHEAPDEVKAGAEINVNRILAIEEEVKHDVIAFVTSIEEKVGPAARYFHFGLTSSDVVDTSFALNLVRALDIILAGLSDFLNILKVRAEEFALTPIMGRSHGIHAEPTTFGLKLALFYSEFKRHQKRLKAARATMAAGQISGPVGNFSAPGLSPEVEELTLKALGLTAASVSSQVLQRDRHAEYFTALALLASSMEKLAVEIRHLARTELGEVEEPFAKGQKGSSAMPHKKNPILAENISGLARLVRANSLAAMENVALWHERDISHSSVERVIGPDSTSLVDFMLNRLSGLVQNLVVHPEKMLKNMALTSGLYNSQELLLSLCNKGLSRVAAYALIQKQALLAHREGLDFQSLVKSDPEIMANLSTAEVDKIFSPERFLRWAHTIIDRTLKQEEQ